MANRLGCCALCVLLLISGEPTRSFAEVLQNGEDTVPPPCTFIGPTSLSCLCDKGQQIVESTLSQYDKVKVISAVFDSCDVRTLPLPSLTTLTIENLSTFNMTVLDLPNLEELVLENITRLENLSRNHFRNLKKLRILRFTAVNLVGLLESVFDDLDQLAELDFHTCVLDRVDEKAVNLVMAPNSRFWVLNSTFYHLENAFSVTANAVIIEKSLFHALFKGSWRVVSSEFTFTHNQVLLMQAEPLKINAVSMAITSNSFLHVGNNPFNGIGIWGNTTTKNFLKFQNNTFKGGMPMQGIYDFEFASFRNLTDEETKSIVHIEDNVMPCSCSLHVSGNILKPQSSNGEQDSKKLMKIKHAFYIAFLRSTRCYLPSTDLELNLVEYIAEHCNHEPEAPPVEFDGGKGTKAWDPNSFNEVSTPDEELNPRKPFLFPDGETGELGSVPSAQSQTTQSIPKQKNDKEHHAHDREPVTGPVVMVIIALIIMVAIIIAIFIVYRQKKGNRPPQPASSPNA